MSLAGRLALVTGGSRGIGAGIAIELAKRGADVAITYVNNQSQAESVKDEIVASGRRSVVIKADQTTLDVGEVVLKGLQQEFSLGTERKLDILVLNGGISKPTPTLDWEVELFDRMMHTNVRGPQLLVRDLAPHLSSSGRVIAITSVIARIAYPPQDIYSATKAALEAIVRHWAIALPAQFKGVTANSVAPGPVVTDMMKGYEDAFNEVKKVTPVDGRLAEVWDIADVVAWMAEEASRWINGQSIQANGGFLMV